MKINRWYLAALIMCFLVGVYVWKATNTAMKPVRPLGSDSSGERPAQRGILVYVGEEPVTTEDLDFEYGLHTAGVFDTADMTPIPDLGVRYEKELTPLKDKLLTGIIERKLLFLYVNQDKAFSIDDPSRFTSCLAEWQQTLKEAPADLYKGANAEKLKERLCERSLIDQYMREVVYPPIKITEELSKQYYEAHKKEFVKPKRVSIRQIVFATDEEAKKVLPQLNRSNFAQKARELSIAPEAEKGGLVGPFAQGEMPRFFDLAFGMAKGEIYGVIKSNYGFHIIMVEDKLSKTEQTYEQARAQIKTQLGREKQQEEYKKWLDLAINAIPVKTPGSKL